MRAKVTVKAHVVGQGRKAYRFASDREIQRAMYYEGLWPAEVAVPSFISGDVDAEGAEGGNEISAMKGAFRDIAMPIVANMPGGTPSDLERRERALQQIVFSTVHPDTGVRLMITRSTNAAHTWRFDDERVERLKDACERVVRDLEGTDLCFKFDRFEVYEQGREQAAARGEIVGQTTRARLRFLAEAGSAPLWTVFVLAAVFAGVLLTLATGVITDEAWQGRCERFASGLLPALLVALVGVVALLPRPGTIRWT